MTGWLALKDEQRKATIDKAEQISGINAKSIEKDWWVTLTLKALFQSTFSQHLVFKGGTSLSKCWKLIARFSEDIDIALAPEVFGMEYKENPTKEYVVRMKKKGCEFTTVQLKEALKNEIAVLGVPEGMVTISAEPVREKFPDTDPQTLYLNYPSLYESNEYIADQVKVEVSVRSLTAPFTKKAIQTLLNEYNPLAIYKEVPFDVEAVEPRKTFLEKTFLLHEEFGKPDTARIRTERMSRHLYDLGKMLNTNVSDEALADHALYDRLVKHREFYSRISWVDYKSLEHTTLSFIPPIDVIDLYRQDYETMQEQMIYEEAIPFNELIKQLELLQERFRIKNQA